MRLKQYFVNKKNHHVATICTLTSVLYSYLTRFILHSRTVMSTFIRQWQKFNDIQSSLAIYRRFMPSIPCTLTR